MDRRDAHQMPHPRAVEDLPPPVADGSLIADREGNEHPRRLGMGIAQRLTERRSDLMAPPLEGNRK